MVNMCITLSNTKAFCTILTKVISSVYNTITNLRHCRITVEPFVDPLENACC